MTNIRSAAATGLPSATIIPFPPGAPPRTAGFEPDDRRQLETAYIALCIAWQFAHLDQAGIDRAVEVLIAEDRLGAISIVRANAKAIHWLYDATGFLIQVDERIQESFGRIVSKLEAN